MKFTETPIAGAYVIEIEPVLDARGFFARTWCADELRARGLETDVAQCSISFNRKRGTLRGLHYQAAPHEEVKIVRCTAGAIFDVIADPRESSPSSGKWFGIELTAANRRMLYIPAGVAHGFQTLEDDTEVSYQMNVPYAPESARGIRWDDPRFAVAWPIPNPILSAADRNRA